MRAILIVQDRAEKRISDLVGSLFDSFEVFTGNQDIISLIYMEPPDIILINGGFLMTKGGGIVREFRSNTIFGNVPIVALLDKDTIDSSSWQDASIDDYLFTGEEASSIATRLQFIAKRSVRELDMNPLTRLPGNESIIRAIQGMLDAGEDIAIAWVDIDNFKPFNDRYGFSRGDEIIMATGRIITNAVREINQEKTFVGHIGGDDFVFMCPIGHVRQLCEEVLSRFDTIMKNFYNDEELDQGGIVSTGRDGTERKYPFMTLTIAVVLNEGGHYTHCGQAAQDATDIKKYLKTRDGSNYMIDRRALKT